MGVAALFALAVIWLAVHQPWLGLTLAPADSGAAGLKVLASTGPAAEVSSGTRLIQLSAPQGPSFAPEGADLSPEPDTSHVGVNDYREFLRRQQVLHALQLQPQLQVRTSENAQHTIEPLPKRPLSRLPASFWLQLLVACSGFMVGVGVYAFRRTDPAASYLVITGLGLMLSAGAAAIYSTRELALDGSLFRVLHAVNGCGSLLFCAAFISTLWHYPTRLGRLDPGPVLITLYLTLALASALQWLPDFDISLRVPILTGFIGTIALAILQWRRTRQRPLERAALQWFLLAWFSGSGLFLGVIFVPALFGTDTGSLQAYAFALFLLIYLGLAFGIARYRLFELDRWWLNAWTVLLSAVLLVAVGLGLIYVAGLDIALALSLSLALVGWTYFPLRQRVLARIAGGAGSAALPQLLQQVIATEAAPPQTLWRDTLARLFRPLDIRSGRARLERPVVSDSGLVLEVPGLDDDRSLRLTGCEGGHRLFGERDIEMAQTVRAVTERLLSYRRAVDIGVERERSRVARDLHDDVGARLLELVHATDGPAQSRVREVLDELRLVIQSLGSNGENLDDLLGMCRAELDDRTEARSVTLKWQQADIDPPLHLDPQQALHVVRVLRESTLNALRHAQPKTLTVTVRGDPTALQFTVHNCGVREPGIPTFRRGLNMLSSRTRALGGELKVDRDEADGWQVTLQLPLTAR